MTPASLPEVTRFVSQTWTLNLTLERPADGGPVQRTRSIIAFGSFGAADDEADTEDLATGSMILVERASLATAGTVTLSEDQLEVEIPVLAGDIDCMLALLAKPGEEDPPALVVVFEPPRGAPLQPGSAIEVTLASIQVELS